MMDSSVNELTEKAIVINDKGIDDLPAEAKAAKAYEDYSKKFEEKMSQEEQLGAKAKKKQEEESEEEIPESEE
jgi:hypothetical protein